MIKFPAKNGTIRLVHLTYPKDGSQSSVQTVEHDAWSRRCGRAHWGLAAVRRCGGGAETHGYLWGGGAPGGAGGRRVGRCGATARHLRDLAQRSATNLMEEQAESTRHSLAQYANSLSWRPCEPMCAYWAGKEPDPTVAGYKNWVTSSGASLGVSIPVDRGEGLVGWTTTVIFRRKKEKHFLSL